MLRIIEAGTAEFEAALERLRRRNERWPEGVEARVSEILAGVRQQGDAALAEFCRRFDGAELRQFEVSPEEMEQAKELVQAEVVARLAEAQAQIQAFHERQVENSWFYFPAPGVILGQLIRPIPKVGVYVPGGKACYPSSLLMNVVPAKVAGVEEVVVCTPPLPDGSVSPLILVAADMLEVRRVFKLGGAQAVAAMAYGTESVPKVDKIVGPGNVYVALAKRQVVGVVDIDMVAGPSEVLVVADGSARADFVAADMLSQAEHDELALAVLVTDCHQLAEGVAQELERQMARLPRRRILERSICEQAVILVVEDVERAIELANEVAPEHLELAVAEPLSLLPKVRHAGAIFLGHYTPEVLGDYLAGPNHVLPTGGTARFYSPLGVYDFVKRSSVVSYSPSALVGQADSGVELARLEGLEAHARSLALRVEALRQKE